MLKKLAASAVLGLGLTIPVVAQAGPGESAPVAWESLAGLGGAAASVGVGWVTGYLIEQDCVANDSDPVDDIFGCSFGAAFGATAAWAPTAVFLPPALVSLAGDGAGSYWFSALGSSLGAAGGAALGLTLSSSLDPSTTGGNAMVMLGPIILLNAAGAVIGYELSADRESTETASESEHSAGLRLQVAPWVTPHTNGAVVAGVF